MIPITSAAFSELKSEVEAHARLSGYYLIKLVDITDVRRISANDEELIDTIFQYLDDQSWPPKEQRPTDQTWDDYKTDRREARELAVQGLMGGPEHGHSRLTISAERAASYFERFDALLEAPKSYYVRVGFGDQEYIFSEGVAIVSATRAGLLYVIEND